MVPTPMVKMTSFTEVRLFSAKTYGYGMRTSLHAGYTFTSTEGLVNYLLQDHSIANLVPSPGPAQLSVASRMDLQSRQGLEMRLQYSYREGCRKF